MRRAPPHRDIINTDKGARDEQKSGKYLHLESSCMCVTVNDIIDFHKL